MFSSSADDMTVGLIHTENITMKTFIASSLIAVTLVLGLVNTASAEPNFGTRAWWEQQING